MKNLFALLVLTFMISNVSFSQNDKEDVKRTVTEFVRAADQQNANAVASLLHSDFRVVMNQLFGSGDVSLMTKETYVQLIKSKKMGGDQRSVDFVSVDVVNQNASVKVILKGKTMIFESLLHLVKTADGKWQLINDLPYATKI